MRSQRKVRQWLEVESYLVCVHTEKGTLGARKHFKLQVVMSRSSYAVSDFLVDRHPAKDEPFSGEINSKENTVAFGNRAIPKLIALLAVDSLSASEKQDALKNVLSLDLAHQETKIYAVQQGLVESIRDCMYDEDLLVRERALEVIGKLATIKQAQDRIVSANVIPLLLDALKTVGNVRIAACNTIQKLSSTRATCNTLVKCNTISHIVPFIEEKSKTTLIPSLEIFAALTSSSDDAILEALASEALPALQKVVADNPDLVLKCCCNLAKHMKGKEAMVQANMLATFSYFLHHKSHNVQQLALSSIMLLLIVVAAKRQACEVPTLIDHLVSTFISGKDPIDAQYAKSSLILISENPVGRREVETAVQRQGGENEAEIRKKLFGVG